MNNNAEGRSFLREKDVGQVYFIQTEISKAIKIGFSADVKHRLYSLQTSSPEQLNLIFAIDAHKSLEKAYHEKFNKHRINREWFKDVPEIWEEIERLKSGNIPEYKIDYEVNPNEPFVMLFNKAAGMVSELNLSGREARLFLCALCMIENNGSGKLVNKDGSTATLSDIMIRAGANERRGYGAVNRLVEHGILAKERTGRAFAYYFNPFVASKTKESDRDLIIRFINTDFAKTSKWYKEVFDD